MRRWTARAVMLAIYAGLLYIITMAWFFALNADPVNGWRGAINLRWGDYVSALLSIDVVQSFGFATVVAVAMQLALLWPIRRPAPGRVHSGRPIWQSVVVISVGLAVLAFGPLIALVQLANDRGWINMESHVVEAAVLGFLPVSWILWTIVLLLWLAAPSREQAIGRFVGLLFAGSIVEIIVTIPFDLVVRRKDDCYCYAGTMITLWFAGSLILWTMGPLALALVLWRRRRPFYALHCPECGYAKGPAAQRPGRCPECGAAWSVEHQVGHAATRRFPDRAS